jgi:hypothetical protein
MSNFNDPVFIEWLSNLAISIGVSLIVAGALAILSGHLLGLGPENKVEDVYPRACLFAHALVYADV